MSSDPERDRTLTRQEMDDWVHNSGEAWAWLFMLYATVVFLVVFGPFWLVFELGHQAARAFRRLTRRGAPNA